MALSGVHIVFGHTAPALGGDGIAGALPSAATASDVMASAGTSQKTASEGTPGRHPMISITASLAIFYAIGPNPDAINGPRRYLDPAFGTVDVLVNAGDKFAWVAA